jgi:hypothetical protein
VNILFHRHLQAFGRPPRIGRYGPENGRAARLARLRTRPVTAKTLTKLLPTGSRDGSRAQRSGPLSPVAQAATRSFLAAPWHIAAGKWKSMILRRISGKHPRRNFPSHSEGPAQITRLAQPSYRFYPIPHLAIQPKIERPFRFFSWPCLPLAVRLDPACRAPCTFRTRIFSPRIS